MKCVRFLAVSCCLLYIVSVYPVFSWYSEKPPSRETEEKFEYSNPELLQRLSVLIACGQVKRVKELLSWLETFDQVDTCGINSKQLCLFPERNINLLHVAICNGQVPSVSYLLQKGANPNCPDSSKQSPLAYCLEYMGDNALKYVRIKPQEIYFRLLNLSFRVYNIAGSQMLCSLLYYGAKITTNEKELIKKYCHDDVIKIIKKFNRVFNYNIDISFT